MSANAVVYLAAVFTLSVLISAVVMAILTEHRKSRNDERKAMSPNPPPRYIPPLGTMFIRDVAAVIEECTFSRGEIHLTATFRFDGGIQLVDEDILVIGEDGKTLHTSTLTGNFDIQPHDTLSVTIDLQLHGLFEEVERWVNVGI